MWVRFRQRVIMNVTSSGFEKTRGGRNLSTFLPALTPRGYVSADES